jgi:hypothetical protein
MSSRHELSALDTEIPEAERTTMESTPESAGSTRTHPAFRASLVARLERAPDGAGVAEGLKGILDRPTGLSLGTTEPADEWEYLTRLWHCLAENPDIAVKAFGDPHYAFLIGLEWGVALGGHDPRSSL